MTREEKKAYENKRPIAVYPMTNWGGLEILDIIYGIEDYVIARYNYGEPQELHRVKINYGVNHLSFRIGRYTFRLDECMRV